MKKIALFISSLQKGGSERVMVNLAEFFYRNHYDVLLVTQYKRQDEYEIMPEIKRVYSEPSQDQLQGNRLQNFMTRFRTLRRIWQEYKPDVILSFLGKNNLMAITTSRFLPVRTVVSVRGEPTMEYEGKLMQFLLASVRTEPELTRREAAKCQKVIAGCTGERQRPYERICQVQKDLPEISGQIRLFEKAKDLFHGQKKKRFLKISVAVLAVLVLKNSERMRTDTAELRMDAEKLEAADREADAAEGADNTEKIEAEDESAAEAAERRFRSYLLSNTRKGNELVMSEGEALERCALWALGTAYERETRVEKAIDVYGRLVEIEENREQIATAGIRKMKLEAGKEQYSIALLTGKRVLERTGTEPEVEKLMQEYELRIQEQESGVQNGQSREEQKKEEQKQEGEINEQNVDK